MSSKKKAPPIADDRDALLRAARSLCVSMERDNEARVTERRMELARLRVELTLARNAVSACARECGCACMCMCVCVCVSPRDRPRSPSSCSRLSRT